MVTHQEGCETSRRMFAVFLSLVRYTSWNFEHSAATRWNISCIHIRFWRIWNDQFYPIAIRLNAIPNVIMIRTVQSTVEFYWSRAISISACLREGPKWVTSCESSSKTMLLRLFVRHGFLSISDVQPLTTFLTVFIEHLREEWRIPLLAPRSYFASEAINRIEHNYQWPRNKETRVANI